MEFVQTNYRQRSIIQKITITSMMLTFVLMFHGLDQFVKLPFGFLTINFSLIFILPIFYFSGPWFGLLSFIIRMIFGMSLGLFSLVAIMSQVIILFFELIAVVFMYVYSYALKKYHHHNYKIIGIFSLTIISTTVIASLLNACIFFPLFISALTEFSFPPSISEAIMRYGQYRLVFFNIPNYWIGVTITYMVGNIIKFSLIFFLYFPLSKIFRYYKIQS